MPTFKAPQYTKAVNHKTGVLEPCYTFNIEFNEEDYISFVAEQQSDISLQSLQKCVLDNLDWWNDFVGKFLKASVKFFSKPYTVDTINKITSHTITGTLSTSYPVNVILVPKSIQIQGGVFTVNWSYNIEQMIDFPDEDVKINTVEIDTLPVSNENMIVDGIQELNIDELPVGDSTTGDALELDSPAKFYDKQRVKRPV